MNAGGAHQTISVSGVGLALTSARGYPNPGSMLAVEYAVIVPNAPVLLPPVVPSPDSTYTLLHVVFDLSQSWSGTPPIGSSRCGGLEDPVSFILETFGSDSDWAVDLDAVSDVGFTPFALSGGGSSLAVGAFANTDPSCAATPAHSKTWGWLKAQYRE